LDKTGITWTSRRRLERRDQFRIKNLTAEIMAEIIRAIERLGGDSKTLPEAPSTDDLVDAG
jgi:hypothetical protein